MKIKLIILSYNFSKIDIAFLCFNSVLKQKDFNSENGRHELRYKRV